MGCEGNAKLVTIDLRRMRVAGMADVGDGPDVLAFDPAAERLERHAAAADHEAVVIGWGSIAYGAALSALLAALAFSVCPSSFS